MSIDYEEIYKFTFHKNWAALLELVHKHAKEASSDEMVKSAVKTFENEFFAQLEAGSNSQDNEPDFQKLFTLHVGRIYQLRLERFKRVVIELVKTYQKTGQTYLAYDGAKFYPEHELCAAIIKEYEVSLPKFVEHSQSSQIKVTQNTVVTYINHTISLFKSQQEVEFFMAVRNSFQMFTVYPNAALSCIINFEGIKDNLSSEERDFFFRGIVDCVVFDHHDEYKPLHFFELDSDFHYSEPQRQRDRYKNKILSLAGQKLY